MQRNYFSILFFIRRTRLLKNGEAPIGLRITVNGQRAEMQIKRSVAEERWNASKGCVTSKDRKALELNQYLESVRTKIYQIHRELLQDGKPVTAFTIIQKSMVRAKLLRCSWRYSVSITRSTGNSWTVIM